MRLLLYFTLFIVFITLNKANAAVCVAIGNGNWSEPTNWSCGSVPGCGDLIVIPAGLIVNIDTQVFLDEDSAPACSTATIIQVYGTLQFNTGFKMELACGSSVEIFTGGSMLPGGGGGSSNWLKICDVEEWNAGDGPVFGYKFYGSIITLPTQFVEFSVNDNQSDFLFSWTMAGETENDYFQIHYSTDGINWTEIIKEYSKGEYSDIQTYYAAYKELMEIRVPIIYFKLSRTDLSGNKFDLEILSHSLSNTKFYAYPNPIQKGQNLKISLQMYSNIETDIFFYNSLGSIVLSKTIRCDKGLSTYEIDTQDLDKGVYLVEISNSTFNQRSKIIVE